MGLSLSFSLLNIQGLYHKTQSHTKTPFSSPRTILQAHACERGVTNALFRLAVQWASISAYLSGPFHDHRFHNMPMPHAQNTSSEQLVGVEECFPQGGISACSWRPRQAFSRASLIQKPHCNKANEHASEQAKKQARTKPGVSLDMGLRLMPGALLSGRLISIFR